MSVFNGECFSLEGWKGLEVAYLALCLQSPVKCTVSDLLLICCFQKGAWQLVASHSQSCEVTHAITL